MSSFLLDTDILSLFQHGHADVCRRCAAAPAGALGITVISVEEQFLGWYTRVRRAKRDDEVSRAYDGMTAFATFIKQLTIRSFAPAAVQHYRRLRGLKLKVGKKDLCIAAIALELNAVVVTRNATDFACVPGLMIEDWSR